MLFLALMPFLGGRGSLSGTEVRVDGARLIVQATSVPLTEVLSRFSEATGTKIVYDAAKPRQLVTVEINAATQAEALSQLLEGQGLSYALRLDPSGRSVEMLFLSKSQGATTSQGAGVAAERKDVERRETYDVIEEPAEVDESNPEPQEPATPPAPDPQLDPTGAAPGSAPPVLGPAVPAGVPGGHSRPWQPPGPSFPQVASYPAWR